MLRNSPFCVISINRNELWKCRNLNLDLNSMLAQLFIILSIWFVYKIKCDLYIVQYLVSLKPVTYISCRKRGSCRKAVVVGITLQAQGQSISMLSSTFIVLSAYWSFYGVWPNLSSFKFMEYKLRYLLKLEGKSLRTSFRYQILWKWHGIHIAKLHQCNSGNEVKAT